MGEESAGGNVMNTSTEFCDSCCKIFNSESKEPLCEIAINEGICAKCAQPFCLSLSFNAEWKNIEYWEIDEHAFYCDVKIADHYRVNMQAKNKTDNIQYDFYCYAKCCKDKDTDKQNVLSKAAKIMCNVLLCKDINEFDKITNPVFVIKQTNKHGYF